ncbi:MAG: hypothetical protein SNJ78_10435, partial [Spirochaetales bacterium]
FRILPLSLALVALAICAGFMLLGHSSLHFTMLLPFTGVALAFVYNQSLFHGVAGSTNRTARMAVHEALLTAGVVVGSSAGGVVYEHLGAIWVFVPVAFLLAGVAVGQYLYGQRLLSQ